MALAAVGATIASEAIFLGSTAQRFLDRRFCGSGDLGRQFAGETWFDGLPMILENGLQLSRLVHSHTEKYAVSYLKMPLFFL